VVRGAFTAVGVEWMAARKRKPSKLALEVFEFIEGHLKIGEGGYKLGQPLKLLPFQRDWLALTLRNPRPSRSILSTGRKNGKTALSAALCLAGLLGPLRKPGSQIVSASMTREQAGILFRYAVKMLRISKLDHLVTIRESAKEIIHGPTGTTYRAISAEASHAVGLAPSLVVMDELGQVRGPRHDLFDALSTSLGSYEDALMLIISTQAATDADLLSLLIDDAAAGHDPRSVVALHCAPDDADPWSEAAWKAANPALGVFRSKADVAQQAAEAQRLPAREAAFQNLINNRRVSADDPFMAETVWRQNGGTASDEVFRRGPVHGGLDLSARQDLTALALCALDEETGKIHVKVHTWTPAATLLERAHRDRAPYDLWRDQGWLRTTPGTSIAYDHLAAEIGEICAPLPIESIRYDRWRIEELRAQFSGLGLELPLVEHGQGFRDMGPAVERFLHHAIEGELVGAAENPVLTWAVSNAVLETDPAGSQKLSKRRSFGRIDPCVALAQALRGLDQLEATGLLEKEGMLFI